MVGWIGFLLLLLLRLPILESPTTIRYQPYLFTTSQRDPTPTATAIPRHLPLYTTIRQHPLDHHNWAPATTIYNQLTPSVVSLLWSAICHCPLLICQHQPRIRHPPPPSATFSSSINHHPQPSNAIHISPHRFPRHSLHTSPCTTTISITSFSIHPLNHIRAIRASLTIRT